MMSKRGRSPNQFARRLPVFAEIGLPGLPCGHAYAVILARREDPQLYTDAFYPLAEFRATYGNAIFQPNREFSLSSGETINWADYLNETLQFDNSDQKVMRMMKICCDLALAGQRESLKQVRMSCFRQVELRLRFAMFWADGSLSLVCNRQICS
jgi:hypothetical protein